MEVYTASPGIAKEQLFQHIAVFLNAWREPWFVQGQKAKPESGTYINMAFGVCLAGKGRVQANLRCYNIAC